MKHAIYLVIAALLVNACASGPDYRRPDVDVPLEPSADAERGAQWSQWWARFEDPALAALVERALDENLDVRIAIARLREAQAALGFARADSMPRLSGSAEALRERRATAVQPGGDLVETTENGFNLVGMLDYEIDLWGRLAREREAAAAVVAESSYAVDALRLGLIADVVNAYFGLRAAEEQRRITLRTIEVREEAVEIERYRYQVGEVDEFILRQAEAQLAAARALLPALEQRLEAARTTLAILTDLSPAALMERPDFSGPSLRQVLVPHIAPEALPLNLLERRPDIRSAEAAMRAANARIGVAEAARLPSLSLSALLGKTSREASELFDGATTWNAGASLVGPVFDFGRSGARVRQAKAAAEQSELRWRQTILNAYAEVRDAITAFQASNRRANALQQQIDALERAAELAQLRYEEGLVSYIEKLDADRTLLESRLDLSTARSDMLTAAATLFKAIGGGWVDEHSPSTEG